MNGKLFLTTLLMLPAIAMAGGEVNPKNGNFSITYHDIDLKSGGHQLKLERTYNSKAVGAGWFGAGWATVFETNLTVMPDGTVTVQAYRNGQVDYYSPKGGANLQAGVDKIVAVVIERDKLDSVAVAALRHKLTADAELRRVTVLKYDIQTQLPEGSVLAYSTETGAGSYTWGTTSGCAANSVTRVGGEYRRVACDRSIEVFNLRGHLIRREEGSYKLSIHYAGAYPDRIEDSLGQKFFLKWTSTGHVAQARTEKDTLILVYTYDERGNLLRSNQFSGNFYNYEYDDRHLMTRITYIDNTHMDMQYDQTGNITLKTDTDGSKVILAYRFDPKNSSTHYWTKITTTDPAGEQQRIREYEYSLTSDAAGVEQVAERSVTEGRVQEGATFDERGRVKRINKPNGGFAAYTYDTTHNKVSSVETDEGITNFQYNVAGDLIRAQVSGGQLIVLAYDRKKQISRIVETNKENGTHRELSFEYNDLGNPIKVGLVGKGEITVEYDTNGKISKVESKQGAKVALEVRMVFQALLDVVKVGGVRLSI